MSEEPSGSPPIVQGAEEEVPMGSQLAGDPGDASEDSWEVAEASRVKTTPSVVLLLLTAGRKQPNPRVRVFVDGELRPNSGEYCSSFCELPLSLQGR